MTYVHGRRCDHNMIYLYRVREEELPYVIHKLRELRLWPGSLWAAHWQPSQKPHLNMQRSNLVRTKFCHFWRYPDIHFRRTSDRHVVTASWAHRRLGEALNTRARVPVLHVTL